MLVVLGIVIWVGLLWTFHDRARQRKLDTDRAAYLQELTIAAILMDSSPD